ncbi:UNVERIFIED_CONTAM: B2 protein [Sesamum radiatum]|uniref:B2 protein n=1 Tax=Sesamum radiatum TaxID=300843 RepID=A0AAW2L383_SESRA
MENSNQSSFWQFSDNLRLQTNSLANLSLNDSIWSTNYAAKRPAEERRNFDFRSGGEVGSAFGGPVNDLKSDFNLGFNNDVWKAPINDTLSSNVNKGGRNDEDHGGKSGKKNKGNKDSNRDNNGNNNGNGESKTAVDKRFKTLPPAESLPRNETIGGYIFVCNNDTMAENLKRQLFGLPPRYRDSVRAITPGLPLFLYNYSTHQLHGIFEAASFGGTNIDPSAWEDKKNPGESRFPAQVRVVTRKVCEPLEEDSFRPILHHYDGPKFRLELNIPEALSLLDIFAENNP